MRNAINRILLSVRLVVSGLIAGTVVSGNAFAEPLSAAQVPTADPIANITLVGLAMIGVVLAKYGIQAAKRMIN